MHCMGRRPISFRCITASRESHPAPKIYLFYVPIIAQGKQKAILIFLLLLLIFGNFHGETDTLLCHIHGKHLHIHHISDADRL